MNQPPATLLSLGVLGTSSKENEHRLPIHPRHVDRIDPDLRARIYLEHGYGDRFGVSDEDLAPLVGGHAHRARRSSPRPTSCCCPSPRWPTSHEPARRPGAVGLAALRAGRRADPGRDRQAAHPDRLGGDEPLDAEWRLRACTSST